MNRMSRVLVLVRPGQINALDSELSMTNELLAQAHIEVINLAETWKKAGVNEKQVFWSHDVCFFEPGNTSLMQALQELWTDLEKDHSPVQVGCGGLQPSERTLNSLLFCDPAKSHQA
jgi:hypothetical protein